MRAELIAVGSELVLGQIIDTNSAYLAKVLLENGIEVVQTTTVGDELHRIEEVIKGAISRCPIVITGGGIGPTEDDLTRQAIADVTHRPLAFQPHLMEQIEALFKKRGYRMAENNRVQAYVPDGAIPIENPKGTAPGFIVEGENWCTISLPGVPSEMRYLTETIVIPYLRKRFKLERQVIQYKTLRTCGLGESALGLQIKDLMKEGQNPSVGTLASVGDIRIRITAKANTPEEASQRIQDTEEEIRRRLGLLIYGVNDETLQGNIARVLERTRLTLTIVETFSGGILTHKMVSTGTPSLSEGIVLPTVESQLRFLGISREEYESLSDDPSNLSGRLAQQARERSGTDLGLALCGKVLEEQAPGEYRFGTGYSLCAPSGAERQSLTIGGETAMVQERSAIIALDLLRKFLLKITGETG